MGYENETRSGGASIVGLLGAAAMVLTGVAPATAATTTWFNGTASFGSVYTEGTVWQSRTGITAGFTENQTSGSLRIYVWFGTAYNVCWANSCDQYDSRSYKKGKLKFNGYGDSSDTIGMRARAENVGPLNLGSSVPDETDSATTNEAREAVVISKGVAVSDLTNLAEDAGAQIYSAQSEGDTYLFVANGASIAVASLPNEQFQNSSLTLATNVPDDSGVPTDRQYVLVPRSIDVNLSSQAVSIGLERIAAGIFVDTEFSDRGTDDLFNMSEGVVDRMSLGAQSDDEDYIIRLSPVPSETEG